MRCVADAHLFEVRLPKSRAIEVLLRMRKQPGWGKLAFIAAVDARSCDSGSGVGDGERKTITVLFADIQGSMDLLESLDPEDARRLVDPALALMVEVVRRFDGHVVQSTGDGIFALFGAPTAHEDHPQRAIYAGARTPGANPALLRYFARVGPTADLRSGRRQYR